METTFTNKKISININKNNINICNHQYKIINEEVIKNDNFKKYRGGLLVTLECKLCKHIKYKKFRKNLEHQTNNLGYKRKIMRR